MSINLISAIYDYNPETGAYELRKGSVKVNPNLKQDIDDLQKKGTESS